MTASPHAILDRFADLRIAVVGDFMLDEYLIGHASRVSPEAPVPVLHLQREERTLGGAGNVAANLRALGCSVDSFGVVGDDAAGAEIRGQLTRLGATTSGIVTDPGRPTVQKVRLVADRHQLARYDREHTGPLDPATEDALFRLLEGGPRHDAIVLSDYAKGTLSPSMLSRIIAHGRRSGQRTVVDPKGSSYARYRGASVLTPNEHEALQASGRHASSREELVEIGQRMVRELDLEAFCITRGPEGVLLVEANGAVHAMPTQAREVFDVTGAGDTYLSAFAAALAVGASFADAARLGNQAAGLVVAKAGTATVSRPELARALAEGQNVYGVSDAATLADELHRSGRRIVFTNGCFDLLHVGHVTYLEKARALGDCLVLGLNSDASVRRLKGPSRPLVGERERGAVLAALRAVDHVVLFDEDTPLRLIGQIRPHILAKGADYRREEVVGHELVESWGGRVELIEIVQGNSTSSIVDRIIGRHTKDE